MSLAIQKALGARLANSPEILALVPAANIQDRHAAPQAFPAIVLGEDAWTDADLTFDRRHVTVFMTLHVWTKEPGLTEAKAIAAAIRSATRARLALDTGQCIDLQFESARFLRDPSGEHGHGVVTLEALVEEAFA